MAASGRPIANAYGTGRVYLAEPFSLDPRPTTAPLNSSEVAHNSIIIEDNLQPMTSPPSAIPPSPATDTEPMSTPPSVAPSSPMITIPSPTSKWNVSGIDTGPSIGAQVLAVVEPSGLLSVLPMLAMMVLVLALFVLLAETEEEAAVGVFISRKVAEFTVQYILSPASVTILLLGITLRALWNIWRFINWLFRLALHLLVALPLRFIKYITIDCIILPISDGLGITAAIRWIVGTFASQPTTSRGTPTHAKSWLLPSRKFVLLLLVTIMRVEAARTKASGGGSRAAVAAAAAVGVGAAAAVAASAIPSRGSTHATSDP